MYKILIKWMKEKKWKDVTTHENKNGIFVVKTRLFQTKKSAQKYFDDRFYKDWLEGWIKEYKIVEMKND